jgi:hypothetical protein
MRQAMAGDAARRPKPFVLGGSGTEVAKSQLMCKFFHPFGW